LQEPNYFLYIVGTPKKGMAHRPGDCGVGRTSIGAGISDAPFGTMYIVSASYMFKVCKSRYPGVETIKHYILKYYGLK
jgi:hypothetical protein